MNCAKRNLQLLFTKTKKALLSAAPFFLRSLISHKNKHTARRPRALEVERVEKTFQWNVFSATVPSRKGERIARRLRGQAHQKKKDTANAVSFSFGALEVECVKKTFQWNVFSTTVPSRKGERIARRLRGQAHQKKKGHCKCSVLFVWRA